MTTAPAPRRTNVLGQGALLVALNVSWALVMARFGRGDIYWLVGLHAVLVIGIVVALRGGSLREIARPSGRDILLGVAVGVIMTLATYPAYRAADALVPGLATEVARLYDAASTQTLAIALAWTMVILTGEELLWRSAWIAIWEPRWGAPIAAVSSLLAYALTQLGSGSIVVVLLACTCGAIWTGLRMYTGRVLPGLIAHAIWTPVVILLRPVV